MSKLSKSKLSKAAMKDYVSLGGTSCPFCKSKELLAGDRDSQESCIFQPVQCESCGEEWIDIFTLTGICE
jgi:hypothetical protein